MSYRFRGAFYPISDREIEQYLCGDLDPEQVRRVERAMIDSAALSAHLEKRRAERNAFYEKRPRFHQGHERVPSAKSTTLRRLVRRPGIWATAGAVAAAAMIVLLPLRHFGKDVSDGAPIRAHGAFRATLTVLREGVTSTYHPGMALREGDRVRLSVESPQSGFLTLLAVEEDGTISVYYDGLKTTAGSYTVPDSLALDNYLGVERWLVILSEKERPAKAYISRIKKGKSIPAPTMTLSIHKEKLR